MNMLILLFGGTIFPNQASLENKQSFHVLWDFISNRLMNCLECRLEWATSLLILLTIISCIVFIGKRIRNR